MAAIAIVVAVQEEFQAFKKKMPSAKSDSVDGFPLSIGTIGGKAVVLCKSGMGLVRSQKAVQSLVSKFDPLCFLFCGFSGGLRLNVKVGDLIVPETVIPYVKDPTGANADDIFPIGKHGPYRAISPSSGWIANLPLSRSKIHRGILVTADRVIGFADEKARIGEKFDAIAIDMETIGGATAASILGKPWFTIRAISDEIGQDLPLDFAKFENTKGDINRGKLIIHVLKNPDLIPKLMRLGKRSARAARNLTDYVELYLAALPVESLNFKESS